MEKTAVDAKTKSYWESYFHEYGSVWVRDIPKRIKSAAIEKLGVKEIVGKFSPMANSVGEDESLSIEAAFVGQIDGKDAKGIASAQFDKAGELKSFEFCRIS